MSQGNSHAPASELRATFTDYDGPTAPYEGRAMRLTICADLAFVAIGKLTEEKDSERFESKGEDTIGVDAEMLYQVLGAMLRRDDRYAHARALEGTLTADDPRLTTTTTVVPLPATRRRA